MWFHIFKYGGTFPFPVSTLPFRPHFLPSENPFLPISCCVFIVRIFSSFLNTAYVNVGLCYMKVNSEGALKLKPKFHLARHVTSRHDTFHVSSASRRACPASRARVERCSSTSWTQPKCMGSTHHIYVSCRDVTSQVEHGLNWRFLDNIPIVLHCTSVGVHIRPRCQADDVRLYVEQRITMQLCDYRVGYALVYTAATCTDNGKY